MKRTVSCTLMAVASVKTASLCKFTMIVGSYCTFFSLSTIAIPLVGAFGGLQVVTGTIFLSAMIRLILGAPYTLQILAYHIPGYCAALYWTRDSVITRFILPAACIGAFIAHPIGLAAWAYTLPWFLPLALYLMRAQSPVAQAFGSTFTAHAVGSVIWMYTTPMSAPTWLALIPIALAERMLIAVGMTAAYYVGIWIRYYIRSYNWAHIAGGSKTVSV